MIWEEYLIYDEVLVITVIVRYMLLVNGSDQKKKHSGIKEAPAGTPVSVS